MSGEPWLSQMDLVALGVPSRTLRDWTARGKLIVRDLEVKAANGRRSKSIRLDSLPQHIQEKYWATHQSSSPGSPVSGPGLPAGEGDSRETSGTTAAGFPTSLPAAPSPTPVELSEAELEQLNELAEMLKEAGRLGRAQRRRLAEARGMSLTTFERKMRVLRRDGIRGLLRQAREDKGATRKYDNQVVAKVQTAYLDPSKPTVATVHRSVSRDLRMSGVEPPSYNWVRRIIGAIPPEIVSRYRFGRTHHNDVFAYVTRRKKPPQPRQWVDSDHHEIDHLVRFPDGSVHRPWLTAFHDICTSEILGFFLTRETRAGRVRHPGANEVALTLRQAILQKQDPEWPSHGLFDNLYVDLGKDYRSEHVRAVCNDLGIHIEHCRPYHGQSKPIERFFGTLETQLRQLPGYIGSRPDLKPEDVKPESCLSVEEFEQKLSGWILKEYHHAPSKGLQGVSPLEALEAHRKNGWRTREIADERALDLLLMRRKNAKVQQWGIQAFSVRGKERFFWADELTRLIMHRVEYFYDPANIGEILVYEGNNFICKARNKELLSFGASEEIVEREREIRRKQREETQSWYEEKVKQAQYANPLARAAAEELEEKVLGQERRRIAASAGGGESVPVILPKFQRAAKDLATGKKNTAKRPKRETRPPEEEEAFEESKRKWMTPRAESNPYLQLDEEQEKERAAKYRGIGIPVGGYKKTDDE